MRWRPQAPAAFVYIETNTARPDTTGMVSVSAPDSGGRFDISPVAVVIATPLSDTTGTLTGPGVHGGLATVQVFGQSVTVPVGVIDTESHAGGAPDNGAGVTAI